MLDHSYYLVFTGLHTAEKKYVLLVLRIGFTFMLDLNIVLMEAFLKMLPILSVTLFTYGRSPGCLSTESLLITLEESRHLVQMRWVGVQHSRVGGLFEIKIC